MVVLGILGTLTAMAASFGAGSKERIVLISEQAKVAAILERAKALALQGYERDPAVPDVCYGVHFNKVDNAITTFKKGGCGGACDPTGGQVILNQVLDRRLKFHGASRENICFVPPYLKVIGAGNVVIYAGNDASGAKEVVVGATGSITAK